MPQTSDVIIVDAGLIGCSTAFHLAQRELKVTVLEKSTLGAGGELSDPEFPTQMFRYGRFSDGNLVRGKYEYSIAG